MRHQPTLIDRVAGKAAAEMVVDAAFADVVEGDLDRGEVARLAGAQSAAPQKLEQRRLREFRRAARAAIDRIDEAAKLPRGIVEFGNADRGAAACPRRFDEPVHQGGAVLLDLLRLLAEQSRDLAQHVDESRPAVTRGAGKICAAPDRLAGGREEHGERPAALLAEMMQRRHVDLIDVGAFLAVDFDVDEELVHHRGGRSVLEALMRHHVAPVTRRIADREQDRLVVALGLGQRVRPPRPPVDRVVLVLEKIRARLVREAVLPRDCGRWSGHPANLWLPASARQRRRPHRRLCSLRGR